jgi:peptidoglycan/LPS O-acetylase OafA/YrhL
VRERGFPALDSLRAIAALSVFFFHAVGFYARGATEGNVIAPYVARLDVGVTIFFLLSGFLLYRPFAVSMATGRPAPSARRYLRRRMLRIVPAYLVTVALVAVSLPENWVRPAEDWWRTLTFTQIYGGGHLMHGLSQTWSLCTEITFYLALPPLAAALHRLAGGRWRVGRHLALLAALGAVSVGWLVSMHQLDGSVAASMGFWLPAHLLWFAAGMAMAVASVHLEHRPEHEHGRLGALPGVADQLGAWWLIAAALLVIASTPVAGPRSLITLTASESVFRELLGAGIATALILPLVFRPEPVGWVRQTLAHGSLSWLGEISYSVFLVHVLVLDFAFWYLGWPLFTGSFLGVFATVLPVSVAVAAVIYRVVERPAMTWRDGRVGTESRRVPDPRPAQPTRTASTAAVVSDATTAPEPR